jgi:hypothetical protein
MPRAGLTRRLIEAFVADALWSWAFPGDPGGFRRAGGFTTPDGERVVTTMWRDHLAVRQPL